MNLSSIPLYSVKSNPSDPSNPFVRHVPDPGTKILPERVKLSSLRTIRTLLYLSEVEVIGQLSGVLGHLQVVVAAAEVVVIGGGVGTLGQRGGPLRPFTLDLHISGAGLVNEMFTKWLRSTYAGKRYAIFALNYLNLHRAPVPLD